MISSAVRSPLSHRLLQHRSFSTTALRETTQALPYFIHRSKTNNLPVYEEAKRGGNLLQTRIRKVEGNIEALREHLIKHFDLEKDRIFINNLTKHVIMKGHRKREVVEFLEEQKF